MKLSVHILTYNCETYIKDALDSIVKQKTSFPFEVVIGDDASSDGTFSIIKTYAKKYDNIKAHRNIENLGILKNFVATLERCRGEYVFDLAGDDWLSDENALQILTNTLDENPSYSFVDSGFDCYFERTKKKLSFYNRRNMFMTKKGYKKHQRIYGNSFMGCCYRKKKVFEIVDFDIYQKEGFEFEDYPILTDLVMNSDFGLIKKVLSTYRIRRESHSNVENSYLDIKLYFAKKYNYSSEEINEIMRIENNHLLHNASLHGNKEIGKKHYTFFRKPMLLNLIYFLSSQSSTLRKFFNFWRKI